MLQLSAPFTVDLKGDGVSTVIRLVVTPASTTSMLWVGTFGGYEK